MMYIKATDDRRVHEMDVWSDKNEQGKDWVPKSQGKGTKTLKFVVERNS